MDLSVIPNDRRRQIVPLNTEEEELLNLGLGFGPVRLDESFDGTGDAVERALVDEGSSTATTWAER